MDLDAQTLTKRIAVPGSIPFHETVTRALVQGQPVTGDLPESPASRALGHLWSDLRRILEEC